MCKSESCTQHKMTECESCQKIDVCSDCEKFKSFSKTILMDCDSVFDTIPIINTFIKECKRTCNKG